jgi:hypothetical protein
MASRSRLLPLLLIAVPTVAVLALGCRTGRQKPFHYTGVPPGKVFEGVPDLVVEIGEDCHADPERAVLDAEATAERDSFDQVLWHLKSEQQGDRVVITSKPASEQSPGDPARGAEIRKMFQSEYGIPPPNNAIRSGKPAKTLLLLERKSAVWKYNIDYYRAGQKLCTYDPQICVQKPGSNGCSE